jgi:hypothetical protein
MGSCSSTKVHGNTGRRYSGRLKQRIRSSALKYHARVRKALAILDDLDAGRARLEVVPEAPSVQSVETPASETR